MKVNGNTILISPDEAIKAVDGLEDELLACIAEMDDANIPTEGRTIQLPHSSYRGIPIVMASLTPS